LQGMGQGLDGLRVTQRPQGPNCCLADHSALIL
jgi:hypothetical protein